MKGNGNPNDKLSTETQGKIKTWLSDDSFTYGRGAPQPGFAWVWDIAGPGGFAVSLGQSTGHPEWLWLSVIMHLDMYQQDVNVLSQEQTKDLLFTLRQRLILLGIRFNLGENLKTITLTEQIFTETLTREKFWRGINLVRRGLDCAKWTLEEKLPEPGTNLAGQQYPR